MTFTTAMKMKIAVMATTAITAGIHTCDPAMRREGEREGGERGKKRRDGERERWKIEEREGGGKKEGKGKETVEG